MLKIMAIAILSLFLIACQPLISWFWTDFTHPEQFSSLPEIFDWAFRNIRYDSDENLWGHQEYWATPEETYTKRAGDCDDVAILCMYFLHEIGIDSQFVLGAEEWGNHVFVRIGDDLYDPYCVIDGWQKPYDPYIMLDHFWIIYEKGYDEVMRIAYTTHNIRN